MAKRYTYEEVMDMTEEEFTHLRERHWLATEVSEARNYKEAEKVFSNPYFKRELIKKGIVGAVILGSVGLVCFTAVKIADKFADNE
jgi:murein endopeptidase